MVFILAPGRGVAPTARRALASVSDEKKAGLGPPFFFVSACDVPRLFVTQRRNRVDSRRAQRRQVACEQRDYGQDQNDRGDRHRVGRRDFPKQISEYPG